MVAEKRKSCDIVTIIVTHNRKNILLNCLQLLIKQRIKTDILIVDNASNDGTLEILNHRDLNDNERIHFIRLDKNTGGAGGFHYGLKYAFEQGWDWFWLMDDDAEPHLNSLEKLVQNAVDRKKIYGSAAVQSVDERIKLCFPIKRIVERKAELVENYDNLADKEQVEWLPFLGFFISRNVIEKIGFPDKTLFIRNDDIEYSNRAKQQGIKIYIVKCSVINHPYQPTIPFKLLGRQLYYRSMPPWKMYYEVRNKIIIAKRHCTLLQGIKSFAGVSLQVLLSIFAENDKKAYLNVYLQGTIDGMVHK